MRMIGFTKMNAISASAGRMKRYPLAE